MPDLSIVYPCYNEEQSLEEIVSRTQSAIGERDVEVILVDNGSTDGTAQCLQALLAKHPEGVFRAVRVPVNRGYGHGIFTGVRAAKGDVICWTHADLQVDPVDVISAYDAYMTVPEWQSCVMKGRRTGRTVFDGAFTVAMSWVATALLGVRLSDINGQPKMFARAFLGCLPDPPHDFSLDLYMLYQAHAFGYRIVEHPIPFGRRQHGKAKGGGGLGVKVRLIRRTWDYMLRLRRAVQTG